MPNDATAEATVSSGAREKIVARCGYQNKGEAEMTGRKYSMALALAASLLASLVAIGNIAQAGWGAPFVGGLIAGHVATNMAIQQRERTQAMQSMAYGGGYGGYGYGRPAYAAPNPCVQ